MAKWRKSLPERCPGEEPQFSGTVRSMGANNLEKLALPNIEQVVAAVKGIV